MQRLTLPNPNRVRAAKSGRDPSQIPAVIRMYSLIGDQIVLPRGAIHILKEAARTYNISLSWDSQVTKRGTQTVPMEDLAVTLRGYQKEVVASMLRGVQGYIKAPCGSGKTVMGASALVCAGEPGLVVVHTKDLLDQWTQLLRSWDCPVRSIAGGSKDNARRPLQVRRGQPEFAVATVQSLTRMGEKANGLLSSAGAILVDEAHHSPANTFRKLIQSCPARYRWGVTATPDRDDGWDVLMPLVLGRELWSIDMSKLVNLGWLMRPNLVAIESGATLDESQYVERGSVNMARALNFISRHAGRNHLLIELAQMFTADNRTTLLLVPRVDQAHSLASLLQSEGIVSMAVTSKVSSGLRKQRLQQLRNGSIQVLVATQAVIIASTGRAAGRAVQRIGRAMRCSNGKRTPIVVDIVDPTPFRGQWRSRSKAYLQELKVLVPKPVDQHEAKKQILHYLDISNNIVER